MRFDAAVPIAVFLGPSLDEASARRLLPANYYPPVRMGDIYRLTTCGVRLIVVIDGVFHRTTPVWQREIVTALQHGITVVGASSMGALRAVELESLGMTGLGTIVQWYRDGRIEGDDEVALQHAEAEFGYRALSEPMVNIRWNLDCAAEAGVISEAERQALTGAMQALDHTRRSYQALFASAAFEALAASTQSALRAFILDGGRNLKQEDAKLALTWCAERLPQLLEPRQAPPAPFRTVARLPEVMLRGVPGPGHALPVLEDLLRIAAEDTARTRDILNHASRRFYLLDWAAGAGVHAPETAIEAFERRWATQYAVTDRAAWAMANGLTEAELGAELRARAWADWLLAQGPEGVGLDRPFLEAWAAGMGIEPPEGVTGSQAFRAWLVGQTPAHFGFDQWLADVAFARELQVSGEIAALAARGARQLVEEGADGARAV